MEPTHYSPPASPSYGTALPRFTLLHFPFLHELNTEQPALNVSSVQTVNPASSTFWLHLIGRSVSLNLTEPSLPLGYAKKKIQYFLQYFL